jgi:hypothetical protein
VGALRDPAEARTVCNEIVDLYLTRIKGLIKQFSWESLIKEFISQHEAYWHLKAYERITTPTNIECYTDVGSHVARLSKDLVLAEETAVALRLLIEMVAAEPPGGNSFVSMRDADRLVAMAHHVISWGTLSDDIRLGIMNYQLSILPSGRVGVESKDPAQVWKPFKAAKTLENIESDIRDFAKHFHSEERTKLESQLAGRIERPFQAEFGLSWTEQVRFCQHLTVLGLKLETPCPSLPKSQLKAEILKPLGWLEGDFNSALELFSLQPRRSWEKAPSGFDAKEDIWPWRTNRRLSYLRRPLIIGPGQHDDPSVVWGPRHVDEALRNLFGLVYSGRYKVRMNSAKEMRDLLTDIQQNASKEFVREVGKWLEAHTDHEVHLEVPIRQGKPLHSDKNLGDIDVLCIDREEKSILSIECKKVNFGRNPREIANELGRFLGSDERTGQSWVEKHKRRDEWLRGNLELVESVYGLQKGAWKVISVFLISEAISASYLREMPLQFLSFPGLQREGFAVFEREGTA